MMALLVKHPTGKSNPVEPSVLRARLLALNNERLPYRIAPQQGLRACVREHDKS